MKNSTSKANSVNKRSVPVTAQLSGHAPILGETSAKKRRTGFSKLPPVMVHLIESESEEEEVEEEGEAEGEDEEQEAEGEEGEEDGEDENVEMAPINEDVTGTNGRVSEGMSAKRSTSIKLADPDVLDCPICYIPLTIPVFQVSVLRSSSFSLCSS